MRRATLAAGSVLSLALLGLGGWALAGSLDAPDDKRLGGPVVITPKAPAPATPSSSPTVGPPTRPSAQPVDPLAPRDPDDDDDDDDDGDDDDG